MNFNRVSYRCGIRKGVYDTCRGCKTTCMDFITACTDNEALCGLTPKRKTGIRSKRRRRSRASCPANSTYICTLKHTRWYTTPGRFLEEPSSLLVRIYHFYGVPIAQLFPVLYREGIHDKCGVCMSTCMGWPCLDRITSCMDYEVARIGNVKAA